MLVCVLCIHFLPIMPTKLWHASQQKNPPNPKNGPTRTISLIKSQPNPTQPPTKPNKIPKMGYIGQHHHSLRTPQPNQNRIPPKSQGLMASWFKWLPQLASFSLRKELFDEMEFQVFLSLIFVRIFWGSNGMTLGWFCSAKKTSNNTAPEATQR